MENDGPFICIIKFLAIYYRYQDWHRKLLKVIARLTDLLYSWRIFRS